MISVVIPVKNQIEDLKASLSGLEEKLRSLQGDDIDLIVVDDGSEDGTIDYLFAHFPTVRLLVNEGPRGWARSVNRGILMAHHEWILVTSPTIIHETLPKEMGACVTPRVQSLTPTFRYVLGWVKGSMAPTPTLKGPIQVPFLDAFLIQKEVWESIDGLDPFFDPFMMTHIALSEQLKLQGLTALCDPEWKVRDLDPYVQQLPFPEKGVFGLVWRWNTRGSVKIFLGLMVILSVFIFNTKMLRAMWYTCFKMVRGE